MRRWKTARRRDPAPEVVAHLAADDEAMVLLSVIGWHGHELPTEVIDPHATRIVRAAPRDLRYNGQVLFALKFAPNITPELVDEIARLEEKRPFL